MLAWSHVSTTAVPQVLLEGGAVWGSPGGLPSTSGAGDPWVFLPRLVSFQTHRVCCIEKTEAVWQVFLSVMLELEPGWLLQRLPYNAKGAFSIQERHLTLSASLGALSESSSFILSLLRATCGSEKGLSAYEVSAIRETLPGLMQHKKRP